MKGSIEEIEKDRVIDGLKAEITRLKVELRETKNKLFNRNREINKLIDETYNEVRLD